MSKKNPTITVVACPWQSAENPQVLELAFQQGSKFIKAYYQAATNLVDRETEVGVMICLGQGGLCSECFVSFSLLSCSSMLEF